MKRKRTLKKNLENKRSLTLNKIIEINKQQDQILLTSLLLQAQKDELESVVSSLDGLIQIMGRSLFTQSQTVTLNINEKTSLCLN